MLKKLLRGLQIQDSTGECVVGSNVFEMLAISNETEVKREYRLSRFAWVADFFGIRLSGSAVISYFESVARLLVIRARARRI